MHKTVRTIALTALVIFLAYPFLPALAEVEEEPQVTRAAAEVKAGLGVAGSAAGFGSEAQSPYELIGNIVNVATGLLGIAFFLILIYAGFIYLTSAGDTTKVDKAKKLMVASVTGMIIIISAYAIASYVLAGLAAAVQ